MEKGKTGNRKGSKNGGQGKSESSGKKKRRPRSAAGERNFICGCGKAYLSYPALYTHVKNKHEGIFPEGSNLKKKFQKKSLEEMRNPNFKTIEKRTFKADFEMFLKQGNAYSEDEELTKEQLIELFPKDCFAEESYYLPVLAAIKETIAKGYEEGIDKKAILELEDRDDLTCDQIIARYILHLSVILTPSFYKEFVIFMCLFRKALNDKGPLYKKKFGDQPETVGDFCCEKDITVAPEISNLFISELYPIYYQELKKKGSLKFLGREEGAILALIQMIKFFCNWLLVHDFTEIKLEINTDP